MVPTCRNVRELPPIIHPRPWRTHSASWSPAPEFSPSVNVATTVREAEEHAGEHLRDVQRNIEAGRASPKSWRIHHSDRWREGLDQVAHYCTLCVGSLDQVSRQHVRKPLRGLLVHGTFGGLNGCGIGIFNQTPLGPKAKQGGVWCRRRFSGAGLACIRALDCIFCRVEASTSPLFRSHSANVVLYQTSSATSVCAVCTGPRPSVARHLGPPASCQCSARPGRC